MERNERLMVLESLRSQYVADEQKAVAAIHAAFEHGGVEVVDNVNVRVLEAALAVTKRDLVDGMIRDENVVFPPADDRNTNVDDALIGEP